MRQKFYFGPMSNLTTHRCPTVLHSVRVSLVISLIIAFGCQQAPETKKENSTPVVEAKKAVSGLEPGSYRFCFVTNDDTALLTIHVGEDGVVAGNYMNQFMGQDRCDGDLENAYFKGDTLIADYKYWSGGVRSLREIRFLIRNGQAREAFGDVEGHGDKFVYKNPSKLFYEGPLLSIATCGGNVDKIK